MNRIMPLATILWLFSETPLFASTIDLSAWVDQDVIFIAQTVEDRKSEADRLFNQAREHLYESRYEEALQSWEQALQIYQALGDLKGQANTLLGVAAVCDRLGKSQQAISYYQKALKIQREVSDRAGEAASINNLGLVHVMLGNYQQAIDRYQQALKLQHEIGHHRGEANALMNLGFAYLRLNDPQNSMAYVQQALTIFQEIGDRMGEAGSLSYLGNVFDRMGDHQQAISYYQQALAIDTEFDDREGKALNLGSIGIALQKLEEPELAIIFLKQSVKLYETIRQDIQGLDRDLQQSYTNQVADTYRHLADLLLQKDRIPEAQQVLDSLKLQELNNYLQNVRGESDLFSELPPEHEILAKYNELRTSAIALGQERAGLARIPAQERTPEQQKRLETLKSLEVELSQQFNEFAERNDILGLIDQLKPEVLRQTVDLAELDALRDDLHDLNAVLLYPLVLEERLELVITTPDSPPLRRTVNVSREQLNQAIALFRSKIQNRKAVEPIAQKFYSWLIEPLEADLAAVNPDAIIYAPDSRLRYVPFAALHDGDRWLTERYRINHITAKSLTNLTKQPASTIKPLAAAFQDVSRNYEVNLGGRSFSFNGLPFAGEELNQLDQLFEQATTLRDEQFTRQKILTEAENHNVLHLATHAAFVPGEASNSFILFGDGDPVTLRDIGSWSLNNIDLVVLSACETALGNVFGNGEEILGLGYQFQKRGAKATVASLWQVDDAGTQTLMTAFYSAMQQGMGKAEALQVAQQTLLTGNFTTVGLERGAVEIVFNPSSDQGSRGSSNLSHPYYWAPFILIGNGL